MEDINLTEHFTLFELTKTSRLDFQEKNRLITGDQIFKLIELSKLGEKVRDILQVPLNVTSGYRCPELNRAEGSTDVSQHLKCEAMDFIPVGIDIGNAFRTLWKHIRDRKLSVGQLIYETASRSYGIASWIHISMGVPYRNEKRCNQILKMDEGKYILFSPPSNPSDSVT